MELVIIVVYIWVERYIAKINSWIIAFDFGLVRIGAAVGNTTIKIPHPLGTITGRDVTTKFRIIAGLIDQWRPSALVVGVPGDEARHADLILKIKRFKNRLAHDFKLPVHSVVEDYTSHEASLQLNEQRVYGKAQSMKLDSLAACAILQTYFNN